MEPGGVFKCIPIDSNHPDIENHLEMTNRYLQELVFVPFHLKTFVFSKELHGCTWYLCTCWRCDVQLVSSRFFFASGSQ